MEDRGGKEGGAGLTLFDQFQRGYGKSPSDAVTREQVPISNMVSIDVILPSRI